MFLFCLFVCLFVVGGGVGVGFVVVLFASVYFYGHIFILVT